VISKLLERKIEIEDRVLRIDPMYLEPLNIEEEYLNAHIKSPSESRANSQPNLEVRTSLHVDESPLDLRRRIVSIDLDLADEMGEKTPVARSKKVSIESKMNPVAIKSPVNDEKQQQTDEKLMKSALKRLSMFDKIDMKVVKESTEEEQEDEESKLEQDEIEEREMNVVEIKELTSESGSQESLTNTESSVEESEEDDDDDDSENEDLRD